MRTRVTSSARGAAPQGHVSSSQSTGSSQLGEVVALIVVAYLARRPYSCSPSLTASKMCGAIVRFHMDRNHVRADEGSVGHASQVEVGRRESGELWASRNLLITRAALETTVLVMSQFGNVHHQDTSVRELEIVCMSDNF